MRSNQMKTAVVVAITITVNYDTTVKTVECHMVS